MYDCGYKFKVQNQKPHCPIIGGTYISKLDSGN